MTVVCNDVSDVADEAVGRKCVSDVTTGEGVQSSIYFYILLFSTVNEYIIFRCSRFESQSYSSDLFRTFSDAKLWLTTHHSYSLPLS